VIAWAACATFHPKLALHRLFADFGGRQRHAEPRMFLKRKHLSEEFGILYGRRKKSSQ
jgi:hypothetical protein